MKGSSRPCTATPPLQTQARQEPRQSSVVSWELLPNERGLSSIAEYRSLDLSPGKQRNRKSKVLVRKMSGNALYSTKTYRALGGRQRDRKSTRLNSSHGYISYAVFCLKKK